MTAKSGVRPRLVELRLTTRPRNPAWSLRASNANPYVALAGWVVDRPSIDAGVPAQAARIITRAACRSHLLTFLYPSAEQTAAWTKTLTGWACVLKPPALKRPLGAATFPLLATSDPVAAERLFDAEGFRWEMRGQVVLLSHAASPPPPLDYSHIERLFGKEPVDRASTQLPREITGLLLPGVDGDFLELVGFDEDAGELLAQSIARECGEQGIGWSVVSESEFASTRWV